MHFAKGLVFRSVVVMACDDDVIPAIGRSKQSQTMPTSKRSTTPERHLLYVSLHAALPMTCLFRLSRPGSEFVDYFVKGKLTAHGVLDGAAAVSLGRARDEQAAFASSWLRKPVLRTPAHRPAGWRLQNPHPRFWRIACALA